MYTPSKTSSTTEAVSIIVCAHNEVQNLKELIPILLNQQYPDYEVIIIDDRSTDETKTIINTYPNLIYEFINRTPNQVNPKKYALKCGIEKANYDVILLTDADCRPNSEHWLYHMQQKLLPQTDIVLGLSPYQKQTSILNLLIQFETYYTSLQYLNATLWNIPYMAVGRNLMYRKHLFDQKWWERFKSITGGDDDLLIGWKSNSKNTNICINIEAQVISLPKLTWKAWLRQKWRHLSVGTYYKPKIKLLLGLLNFSQIGFHSLFWILLIGQVCIFTHEAYLLGGLYLARLFIFVIIMKYYLQKIKGKINWMFLPFLELFYTIYLLGVGTLAMSIKRNKW